MIKLFYGRENMDKEKFIFEHIADSQGQTIVIVPEQYTLECEKQALKYLRTKSLLYVDVTSLSRLGNRILNESPYRDNVFLNQYGRHVVLTKLLKASEDNLELFKDIKDKALFIEQVNDFISKAKQFNVTPQQLELAAETLDEAYFWSKGKLKELAYIYNAYEEAVSGVYTDSEDLISLYSQEAAAYRELAGKDVWVYGFDSFTPRNMQYLMAVAGAVKCMNIWLTGDRNCQDEELFVLSSVLEEKFRQGAADLGLEFSSVKVNEDKYKMHLNPVSSAIEKHLFAVGQPVQTSVEVKEHFNVVKCANYYNEAHSICSKIMELVSDGMMYKDIVIINNDEETRGPILRRTLEEFGIATFNDGNRKVVNSPVSNFVLALMDFPRTGFNSSVVLRYLKSYMTDLSEEEMDLLENYVIKYRIKGKMWERPFEKGLFEYSEEELEHIDRNRQVAIKDLAAWNGRVDDNWSYAQYIEEFFSFLEKEVKIQDKIQCLAKTQDELGLTDESSVTLQIWKYICNIAEQIHLLMGDEKVDLTVLNELFLAGLEQVEVGRLPQGRDQVLVGTMQRTRIGQAKAVMVMGAVDGNLPMGSQEDGLLGWDDIAGLEELGHSIAFGRKVVAMEENLAIYRNLIKPQKFLMMTYSIAGSDGAQEKPSQVVDKLVALFEKLSVENDYQTGDDIVKKLGGKINNGRQYLEAVGRLAKKDLVEPGWSWVESWMKLDQWGEEIIKRLSHSNEQLPLGQEQSRELFFNERNGAVTVSPSRLEKFSRCPFSHFISYGLKPEEWRLYGASSREIGDVYHEITQRFIEHVKSVDNISNLSMTDEEALAFADEMIENVVSSYREGVFGWTLKEAYLGTRIAKVGRHVCLRILEQLRTGCIDDIQCETQFGYSRSNLPPITINTTFGQAKIAGKIDRVDHMSTGRVAVIDYKTGHESFDIDEASCGYRLQLMLYLDAACKENSGPLGVFYFHIGENRIDGDFGQDGESAASMAMGNSLKMNGAMVNSQDDIKAFVNVNGEGRYQEDLLDVKIDKNSGCYVERARTKRWILSNEEFTELQEQVKNVVEEISAKLMSGNIEVSPLSSKSSNPCTYCAFSSICMIDTGLEGCRRRKVRANNILSGGEN